MKHHDLYRTCAVGVIITAICTVLLNAIIMAAYCIMPASLKKKVPNVMCVNQACANVSSIVPSLLISTVVFLLLDRRFYNPEVHQMYWVFFLYTNFLVVLSLFLSTLDRFLHLKFPSHYVRTASVKKAVVIVVVIWLISTVPPSLFRAALKEGDVYSVFTGVFTVLLVLTSLVLILLAVTFINLRGVIHHQMEMKMSLSADETKEEERKRQVANERQLVCVLFLRTCTYMCTLLPHIILRLVVLHRDMLGLPYSVRYWLSFTYLVYSFNGVLDPLLTIFLRQDFHRARRWVTLGLCSGNITPVRQNVDETIIVTDEV